MAFTFVVEDGTGLSNAASYVSVTEADDYFAVDINADPTWITKTTQQKEFLLAWGSRLLDQKVVWRGAKAVLTSALRWPRVNVVDRDGNFIAANVIPVQVKQAVFEMAKFVMSSGDPTTGQNVDYLKQLRVDVIELVWQDRTGQSALPSLINEILNGLGGINTGGPRFVPIAKV